MRKIIIAIISILAVSVNVFAQEEIIDVFEEYASFDDDELKTFPFEISTEKNTKTDAVLLYSAKKVSSVILTKQPSHGDIDIDGETLCFSYTPDSGYVGKDCFCFRISDGESYSNISMCSINIGNIKTTSSSFYYADMVGNPHKEACTKLMELDIIKGERIGKEYYFYPKNTVSRMSAVSCLNRIKKQKSKKTVQSVFCDISSLGDSQKREIYTASSSGIINGTMDNKNCFFYPDEPIKKVDFLCMADRMMNTNTASEIALPYADNNQIPDYALLSVKNLVAKSIISAKEGEFLNPNKNLTKEEMAQILYNIVKYEQKNETKNISNSIKKTLYSII